MINFTTGDIFKDDAQAIVNPVNCVGVMGKGLALEFKRRFPRNFQDYAAACREKQVQPGSMFISSGETREHPGYIINFPTKRHWRDGSRLEDIRDGLRAMADDIRELGIRSVAVPALGSGLGGLDWEDVRDLIREELSELDDVSIRVYEPRPNGR